ncbi:heme-binding protein [Bradyrhizobium sp.]|uniref:GlcG/HbpS family heme-binding protein n=1 Tax=Bradyrhizobium sp. TaxID=376 RepID=UPI002637EA82|nr:heme-binding protein [Bradyrhizobium sp.]
MTLDQANRIIAAALAKGAELGLQPLTVAVVDAGGHLVALARQDGASMLRPQVATGKAVGALALGVSSRRVGEMAAERPAFVQAVSALSAGGLVPAAGGLIAVSTDGAVQGAVGISGDSSDNDERCALAAIQAVGLAVKS